MDYYLEYLSAYIASKNNLALIEPKSDNDEKSLFAVACGINDAQKQQHPRAKDGFNEAMAPQRGVRYGS